MEVDCLSQCARLNEFIKNLLAEETYIYFADNNSSNPTQNIKLDDQSICMSSVLVYRLSLYNLLMFR